MSASRGLILVLAALAGLSGWACQKAGAPGPAAETAALPKSGAAASPAAAASADLTQTAVDDAFVRKYMPEFPQAVLFRPEHLAFFSKEQPEERKRTEEGGGTYLLRGDFNGNGKPEIALSGLGSLEPIEGDYKGFVLILEWDGAEWKDVGLDGFPKPVQPTGGGEDLRNLLLKDLGGGRIQIGFAAATDFTGVLEWKGARYEYRQVDL